MDDKNAFLEQAYAKMYGYRRIRDAAPGFVPRLRVGMRSDLPEALRLAWELAVYEMEENICPSPYGGEYFTAGGRGGWEGMVFGQDTVAAGLLSLNRLYPDLMWQQLRTYVLARLNIGFMGPDGWVMENCEKTLPLNMDVWSGEHRDFARRYFISPAMNRTGEDVGWIWAAGDLFDVSGDRMDWAWLYGMGEIFFNQFYRPFYDEKDGLYFGQASFIDVGGDGYPVSFGRYNQQGRNAAVWIKAPSTNALYVRDMDVMAHAAQMLGRDREAKVWGDRAEKLRRDIREHLRLPDGTFAYFMHKDGHLEERREALGAAYCVLADVVKGEEAITALALDKLPVSKAGVTLFYPFYEDTPEVCHNRSAWPFVSTFYFEACEKATGKDFTEQDAIQLANAIMTPEALHRTKVQNLSDFDTGTFNEFVRWEDQKPIGVCSQIYTISAFMNLCLRKGWLDQKIPRSRFW